MKMKNGVPVDLIGLDVTPDSGVDVKDTQMLKGQGELPAGYNAVNKQEAYTTGAQPRGKASETGSI